MKMPIVFIGHGSPMNAIEDNKFTDKWIDIFKTIPKPKGILAISAHWYTKGTRITTVKEPKMVYDMSGFPKELYEINYDAITDELLIKRVEELLGADNIIEDNTWGYDHGIWSILNRVYPEQEIPLVVLSVDAYKTPKEHYEFGKKLRELREEGYLILASGNIVHNLGLVDFQKENGYDWAEEFDNEIKNSILSKKIDKVINFENIKNNNLAFRTPEHFLPILYILGAVHEEDEFIVFNDKCIMGSLSMTSYLIK